MMILFNCKIYFYHLLCLKTLPIHFAPTAAVDLHSRPTAESGKAIWKSQCMNAFSSIFVENQK